MNKIKEINTLTKALLGLGLLFLIYGFLSEIIPIYFFWESKSIGWASILIGLICLLSHGIEKRKINKKNTIGNKIGIGFIVFILLIQSIFIVIIPNSDAYQASKVFIKSNQELITEFGEIKGFGLIPTGAMSVSTDSNGETGAATINIIIKGDKAYKRVTVYLFKDYETKWEVHTIE